MRQEIAFNAEGVTLRGWLCLPDRTAGPVPTVVMAHGFSAVKEMYLDAFADVFVQAGFGHSSSIIAILVPVTAHHARKSIPGNRCVTTGMRLSYACTLPTVDATRIGIWGSSYSGGHVLVVGAIDRRVCCVVSQVPLISGHRNARRLIRSDFIAAVQAQFDEDRRRRFAGEPPAMIPVVAENPLEPSCCRRQTLGSGSPRQAVPGRQRGRTRSPYARPRCSWRTNPGVHRVAEPHAALADRGPRRSPDRRR